MPPLLPTSSKMPLIPGNVSLDGLSINYSKLEGDMGTSESAALM